MSTVSPELWRRAEVVFECALDQSAERRDDFVCRVCGDDDELRAAVEALFTFTTDGLEPQEAPWQRTDALSASGPTSPWCGRRVGSYRILRPIGLGGMGRVFLAERADGEIEQQAAVKLLQETRPAMLRLFRRERRILARLEHPNIARFLDGGVTEDGALFVVLEFVAGIPITDYCDARRLSIEQRLELFFKACRAVQYAHQNLIVHCDLKPGNVLVTDEGEPKLLDFGIAKLLDLPRACRGSEATTDARFLTPAYASPEQIEGRSITMASDIYSLGVLLHEILSGCLPIGPGSVPGIANMAATRVRPPSEIVLPATADERSGAQARSAARSLTPGRLRRRLGGDLDSIVLCCLCHEPGRRYSSVEGLVEDLRRHLRGLLVRARPPRVIYRVGKFVRRHTIAVTSATLAALALVAFGLGTVQRAEVLAHERDLARRAHREAQQVTRFLTDAFRLASAYQQVDPSQSPNEGVTVRQALEYSAERIDRELKEQPMLRARLLNTIGSVYSDLGFIDQGVAFLREALATRRRTLGAAHPEVVESLNSLGFALHQQGRIDEAEPMLRTALAASRGRPDAAGQLAESLLYLGDLLVGRGDPVAAVPLLREALLVRRQLENPASRSVAEALTNLGTALWLQGDLAGAEPLLRESLTILHRVTGEAHPEVAAVLHTLGWVVARQGDDAQGEALLGKALAISRQVLGPEHPETLAHLAAWGDYLAFAGDYAAAEKVLREVLEADRAIKGSRHPDVAQDLNTLALSVWQQGELAAAEPLLREALEIARASWGQNSVRTATYLHNLGALRSEMGAGAEAEPILEEALEIRSELAGRNHTGVAITLTVLADLKARRERFTEALSAAEEAVAIFTATLRPGHWRTAIARSVRGDCLTGLRRYAEAEKLLLETLPQIEAARGTDSRPARSARRRLARLMAAKNRPAASS